MPPAAVRSQEAQGLAIGMLQGKRAWKPALPKIAAVNGHLPLHSSFKIHHSELGDAVAPSPRRVNAGLIPGRAGICSEFRLQAVFHRPADA